MDRRITQNEFEQMFEFDGVLSTNVRAKIVTEVIKFILFQRQQIPMTFDSLKTVLGQETQENVTTADSKKLKSKPSIKTAKQRELAKRNRDLEAAEQLFDSLQNIFTISSPIKQVLFMFGSTIVSPKEMFLLDFPTAFYDGPLLNYKQCLSYVFRKMVTEDIFGDVPTLKSILKMSVMILAPRDHDYSSYRLIPKLGYKIPSRGTCKKFTFKFECQKNVSKLGAELSMMGDTFFDISGIEPLNKTLEVDSEILLQVQTPRQDHPRSSSVSASAKDHTLHGPIPTIEISGSPISENDSTFSDDSGNNEDYSDFIWYLLPHSFNGFKEKAITK